MKESSDKEAGGSFIMRLRAQRVSTVQNKSSRTQYFKLYTLNQIICI